MVRSASSRVSNHDKSYCGTSFETPRKRGSFSDNGEAVTQG
jgi:hypothetical protein